MDAPPAASTTPSPPSPSATPLLHVRDLGHMAYAPALELQRTINQAVIDGTHPPTLLLVEHDPVVTISHRKSARDHLVAPPALLASLGIDVQETDRGGDITYHGPGQLVGYPIVRLGPLGLNLGRYMRALEAAVIDTLATLGVKGVRDETATGVWVPGPDGELAKICAMGVRVRKNTTMHGLALNVSTELSHFATIVPCGLAGRPVTSLEKLLGRAPAMADIKQTLSGCLAASLGMRLTWEMAEREG